MPRLRIVILLTLGVGAFGLSYALTRLTGLRQESVSTSEGMVWISAGEFWMGTDADDAWKDEKPAHRVRVDGFWIDATEVTNAQFQKFVDETQYLTTAERTQPPKRSLLSRRRERQPRRQSCWFQALWSLRRPMIRFRWMMSRIGGRGHRAQTGDIPRGPTAI